MLTDFCHPCQILADAMTIQEHFGDLSETPICYLGDGNNIVHSWLNFASRVPITLTIATTEKTLPNMELVKYSQRAGISEIRVINDPVQAVREAKILYADVWASMGEKEKAEERKKLLMPYQINSHILLKAASNAKIMHCLPAERGWEITSEVLDGPQSIVLDQAENRLYAQKAILLMLDRWFRS
jgi:ornithine carbamoyltransferase